MPDEHMLLEVMPSAMHAMHGSLTGLCGGAACAHCQRHTPLYQWTHAPKPAHSPGRCIATAWVNKVREDSAGADMGTKPHQAAPLGHVVEDGLSRSDVVIDAGLPSERPLTPHHAHPAQAQPGGPDLNLNPSAGHTIIRLVLGGPGDDSIASTVAQNDPRPRITKGCP